MKLIGPKCSKCCFVTSVWGIIMFLVMGGAFYLRSPALYEDIPTSKTNSSEYADQSHVFKMYYQTGQNCFIAAGLYVLVLFFSLWQMRVNDRMQVYLVH